MPMTDLEVLQERLDQLHETVGRLQGENREMAIKLETYAHILFGSATEKGLIHTIKDINEKISTVTKVGWLIIAAIVGQTVATIWSKI
jgi:hypothetical protein